MHESLLVRELLEEVFGLARREAIANITKIRVNTGKDSHISPESLRFHFEQETQGSPAEESAFEIQATTGASLFLVSLDGE